MRKDATGFTRDHLNLISVENKKAFLHNLILFLFLANNSYLQILQFLSIYFLLSDFVYV